MSADRIRELNDQFRRSRFQDGQVAITRGVNALPRNVKAAALLKVVRFSEFTTDDDPHGEHDFGSFEVDGHKLFWKIDLYEEPEVKGADGQPVTTRVLTIMLAEEW